ncbi:MAG: prepilin-type N-terminal cleavage/methylation domain-containing protein [Sedimentisphaerales bacterium]|nr:prepilin-type N-terminal cleavage/methylation domain-containing protein [Sedimentisphaerales bacterium]
MKKQHLKKEKGFTLIELLVVVSIIALLVSILLPALSQARIHARDAICMTRHHNLYLAFATYAAEHENRVPERKGYVKYTYIRTPNFDYRDTLKPYLEDKMESFTDPLCPAENTDFIKSASAHIEGTFGVFVDAPTPNPSSTDDDVSNKFGTPLKYFGYSYYIITGDWMSYKTGSGAPLPQNNHPGWVECSHKGKNNSLTLYEFQNAQDCLARWQSWDDNEFGDQKFNYSYYDGHVNGVKFSRDEVPETPIVGVYPLDDAGMCSLPVWRGVTSAVSIGDYCTFLPYGK